MPGATSVIALFGLKFLAGKLKWVAAGLILALVAALIAAGWALKASLAREAQAKQEAATLRSALESQAAETEAAMRRYVELDAQFLALNKRKADIRETVKTEYRYITEAAKDEGVADYLSAPVPGAINCLLSESCGGDADDNRPAA